MIPLTFSLSRIENLMHQVTFNPLKMEGDIITNTSMVDLKMLQPTLRIFRDVMESGLAVSPYLKVETLGSWAKIYSACSITVSGVLLKAKVPVRPKGGGVIEVIDRQPIRFTDMLMYWATTIDPIDVLISQELTSVLEMMRTGSGRILGNLQEAPMLAVERIEERLEILAEAGFSGVLDLGEPNMNVLGVSVERDHVGLSLVGGTNIVAAAMSSGIRIDTESISGLTDIREMTHIEDLL
ncbi:MAG: Global nitrogen regulator NrpRII [Methanothrix sp.]|nr:MAG: Global nitrogen regulator NrpRII [Methanothrix sp.]